MHRFLEIGEKVTATDESLFAALAGIAGQIAWCKVIQGQVGLEISEESYGFFRRRVETISPQDESEAWWDLHNHIASYKGKGNEFIIVDNRLVYCRVPFEAYCMKGCFPPTMRAEEALERLGGYDKVMAMYKVAKAARR